MRIARTEFLKLVHHALAQLPPRFQEALDRVDILVEDWPTPQDTDGVADRNTDHLLGLCVGVPLVERGSWEPLIPDKIVLFRRPIEIASSSREEMAREIRVTLLHEVGHYLGMGEEELELLGYG